MRSGILADLVEDHDLVVERVAEDGEETDDGSGRHLEPGQRVDAHRHDEVLGQGEHAGQCHLPSTEVHRHKQ